MVSRAGSPRQRRRRTAPSQPDLAGLAPGLTPTTTKGRLASRSAGRRPADPGAPWSGRPAPAPLRSGVTVAAQLGEECVGAEEFEDRETLPCPRGRTPESERWAASGAMALTGLADATLGPPDGLVDGVEQLARALPRDSDALALLGERAALMGLWRRGDDQLRRELPPLARHGWLRRRVAATRGGPRAGARLARARRQLAGDGTGDLVRRCRRPGPSATTGALLGRAVLLGLPVAARRRGERHGRDVIAERRRAHAPAPRQPDRHGPLRRRPLGALGGPALRRPAGRRRRRGHQGGVDGRGPTARGVARPPSSTCSTGASGRSRSISASGVGRATLRAPRGAGRRRASRRAGPAPSSSSASSAADDLRGRRTAGLDLHHRLRPPAATCGNRVAFGDDAAAAGGLVVWHGRGPAVLRRRRRRPAHGVDRGRAPASTALAAGWSLAARRLHGRRRAALGRSDAARSPRRCPSPTPGAAAGRAGAGAAAPTRPQVLAELGSFRREPPAASSA